MRSHVILMDVVWEECSKGEQRNKMKGLDLIYILATGHGKGQRDHGSRTGLSVFSDLGMLS